MLRRKGPATIVDIFPTIYSEMILLSMTIVFLVTKVSK